MLRLLVLRFASLAATLVAVSAAIFLILEVLPGDPAASCSERRRGKTRSPRCDRNSVSTGRRSAVPALDRRDPARRSRDVDHLSHARLDPGGGQVRGHDRPGLLAILISTAIAIRSASWPRHIGTAPSTGVMVFSQLGVAIPNFWLGILGILVFSTALGWMPAGGFRDGPQGLWPALKALLLPAVALALPQAAVLTRVTRSATLEVIGVDFVHAARAKGLSEGETLRGHVVPNALIPVATILGLQLSFFFGGAILVENVFNPVSSRLAYQALAQRDLVVIKDVVLIFSGLVILVDFAVDLGYLALDPRLRSRARAESCASAQTLRS